MTNNSNKIYLNVCLFILGLILITSNESFAITPFSDAWGNITQASNDSGEIPNDELCNDLDDNLDGVIDEGFDIGAVCAVGIGACQNIGVKICSNDQLSTVCNALPNEPSEEICDGIDNDCDGEVDEGFSFISGTCYANSDIDNFDECNPTDVVVDKHCYNPEDYNKKEDEITDGLQPLPAVVTASNTSSKIKILMKKYKINSELQKKLQKKALKKLGIKNAKLKVSYSYVIIPISKKNVTLNENEILSINAVAKKKKNSKIVRKNKTVEKNILYPKKDPKLKISFNTSIRKTVKKNETKEKKLTAGQYKLVYRILIQTKIKKKPVTLWGNQKSNKWSKPVNFVIKR